MGDDRAARGRLGPLPVRPRTPGRLPGRRAAHRIHVAAWRSGHTGHRAGGRGRASATSARPTTASCSTYASRRPRTTSPSPACRSPRTPTTPTGTRCRRCSCCTACPTRSTAASPASSTASTPRRCCASEDPAAFDVLTRTPVTFQFSDADTQLTTTQPMIGLDPTGRIREVRFNNRSMQPLRLRARADRVVLRGVPDLRRDPVPARPAWSPSASPPATASSSTTPDCCTHAPGSRTPAIVTCRAATPTSTPSPASGRSCTASSPPSGCVSCSRARARPTTSARTSARPSTCCRRRRSPRTTAHRPSWSSLRSCTTSVTSPARSPVTT